MMWRRFKKLAAYLPNVLVPRTLRNVLLSVRTKSFISPRADIYHVSKVTIGRNCILDACLVDANTTEKPGIVIGDSCLLHRDTVLRAVDGSIRIGNNVSMQHFSILYGIGNTVIGDNVLIASHCAIGVARHCVDKKDVAICDQGVLKLNTRIESNVWIGAQCTIFSGVTIGEGAVIGAGSVVNRDIPPFSVAAGVPARVIRKR